MTKLLFEPLKLKNGTVIKNRLYKGAMSEAMAINHRPTDELIRVYQRWALGGIGMSLTGNVMVDRRYLGEPGNVVIEDDRDMDALKRWAQAGTENGSHIWMQINHPGKQSPKSLTKEPVAPSAVPITGAAGSGFNPPRAMTTEEIKETVDRFITTARIAKEAGFTGVQIHGAHGYLVSQFLSPHDNRRTDEYGGSLEKRMRFLIEIYQGMREALGEHFPISLKINSTDFKEDSFTEEESTAVIKKMADLGMDLIEISGGDYEKPKMMGDGEVYFLDYAKKISQEVDMPIAVIGGFRKKESMVEAIEETDVSMIGIARPLVLRPDLPNRLQNGTYNNIELPRLKTGIKALDDSIGGFAGLTYYEQQISRLGRDLPPVKHTNAWSPLFHLVKTHGPAALSPRRR
ncbi:NADH:flavin oxidoreductase/NADH oxidase family protein [Macrococcus carouselicus]|uniref:NADH:flavin oxidoreductase/NADH oxidase family protein n=1 Tax=Macrococcus carouselicus TaxID=69969 RepID=A0A9Q8FQY9_9STAP|nr:NADH:flavin oxidoreductase/NADH oxidase family protein [Macrococcus carouselicus]TDM02430.1 NADH:flavin oxidoreductase/NADH oxidase family protein [Macrococcus carouselicus]